MSVLSERLKANIHRFCQTVWLPFCQMLTFRKASGFFLALILTGCMLAYGTFSARMITGTAALLFSISVILLAYRKRFWYAVFLPLTLGILLASGCSLLLFDGYVGTYAKRAETETVLDIDCEVTDVVYTNAYSGRYIVRVSGEKLPYSVVVSTDMPYLEIGQKLTGEIRFLPWEDAEDGFDEERYYLAKGVVSAAEDVSLRENGICENPLRGLFTRWNRYLSAKISAHVRNDGLPLAMLLGNRSELDASVKRDFRRLGILHLLAVSGTHFTMLSSAADRFLIRLRFRPVSRYRILALLTVLYMFLTGMTASVRRAGIMFLFAILCRRLERKVRYFSSLNIACGLILLFDPFAVLDMGLHLSYLAVCGCILAIRIEADWPFLKKLGKTPVRTDETGKPLPPVRGWRRKFSPRQMAKQTLSMLLLNLVITAITFPLSWLYFGEMSLLSLAVNLFYIPMTGVLLILTLLYLLLYPLRIFIVPMAELLSGFASFLELPASVLSHIPHISLSLLYPFIPVFIIPLVLTACMLPFIRKKIRGVLTLTAVFVLMCTSVFVYETATSDQSVLVYRNDRVKDGFVLRSAGEVLLVDISDGSGNFTDLLLTEAKELYATELGGYMVTHYHNRHAGTLQNLSDEWILRKLYLPEPITEEEEAVFHRLAEIAADKGIKTIVFDSETAFGHASISLAERTYLSRSTHPVTGLTVTVEDETLAYVSSSFSQGDPAMLTAIAEADAGIFGAHSPVTKKTFALPIVKQPKVYVWNGDSAFYYEGTFPVAATELYNAGRFAYRFPDATE